jgi:hypothetical protein
MNNLTRNTVVEWLLRPMALAGIVALIEQDRLNAPLPAVGRLAVIGCAA